MNLTIQVLVYATTISVIGFVVSELRTRRRTRKEFAFHNTPNPKYPFRTWIRHPIGTFLEFRRIVGENMHTDMQRYMIHLARVREYNEMMIEKWNEKERDSNE